jgi:hypothetical protein
MFFVNGDHEVIAIINTNTTAERGRNEQIIMLKFTILAGMFSNATNHKFT